MPLISPAHISMHVRKSDVFETFFQMNMTAYVCVYMLNYVDVDVYEYI